MKINAGGKDFNLQVGVYANTDPATKEIKNFINQTQKTSDIKLDIKVNSQGRQVVRQVKTETGDLITITKQYDKQGQLLNTTVNKLSREYKNLTTATKRQQQAQQTLNTSVSKSKSVFSDFADTFMKMVKFNTINIIYDKFIDSMSNAIEVTENFNKTMVEFKKVTDTSKLSMQEYLDELTKLGEGVSRTTTEMLAASTEFSKGGFTAENSAKLAVVSSLYQNIADAELSAGEAASYVISQMKAFNIKVDDAISIIDKTNEVSNNFAVSSSDVAMALTKQSAALASYGNDINEVIGLVTSGAEILTGNTSKVARGIKGIGANIVNMAQSAKTLSIQVNGVTKEVQLWNEAGSDILSTYNVLKQISVYWKDMTDAEKSALAISIAGKNQLDVFTAVEQNFASAIDATNTALNAQGSAMKENQTYMEQSIEAHKKKLQAQYEQFITSLPLEQIEKVILDIGTTILKIANNDLVQLIVKLTAIGVVISNIEKAWNLVGKAVLFATNTKVFDVVFQSLGHLLDVIMQVASSETILIGINEALTASMLANPMFWGAAAVVGIYAIYKGIEYLSEAYERNTEKLHELNQESQTAQDEVKNLIQQLESLKEQIDTNNQLALEVTDDKQLQQIQSETKQLERQEAVLRNELAIAKAKADEAEREAKAKAKQVSSGITDYKRIAYETSYTQKNNDPNQPIIATVHEASFRGTPQEVFKKEVEGLRLVQEAIAQNNRQYEILMENEDENSEAIAELTKKNASLVEYFNKAKGSAVEEAQVMQDLVSANYDFDGSAQALLDDFSDITYWNTEATDTTKNLTDAENENTDAVDDNDDAWKEHVDQLKSYAEGLQNIQDAYDTAKGAFDEYNEKGQLSIKTYMKLLELQPQYLACLIDENGQIVLNAENLSKLWAVEKQEAIVKLEEAKANKLAEFEANNLNKTWEILKTTLGDTTDLTNAASAIAGINAQVQALTDEILGESKERKSIDEYYDALINGLKNTELDWTNSTKSSAGAHKDAWVEAFEEEQRQLKHLLETDEITEYEYYERLKELNEKYFGEISGKHQKYIKEYQENEEEIYKGLKSVYDKVKDYLREAVEQGYEDAINALKKEEKNVLAEIKKQIEAIKNEKQSVIKGIEKQINALKREKEAVQKYYNEQIDAIKRENEELQKQNELLEYQQALEQAKAQKVMVMKDGRFQLTENESAVAQAEQNLGQYQEQLSYEQQIQQLEDLRDAQIESIEARIESLEEYKDYMEEYYDEQIEAMENYYNQVQEQYEKQIDALQEQLDAFKAGYKKSEDLENARLATQVLGANEEASIWAQRLKNLAKAVTEYNKILALAGKKGVGASSAFEASAVDFEPSSLVNEIDTSVKHRASGDASFASDEVALVGESPNTELVIGSQLNRSINNGSLVHLSKGSGVVNAESTRTLAGLLNGLGSTSNVSNSRLTNQHFSFGNITLPNVTDADSFVNTLSQKFNNYSIQYSNTRK